MNYKVIFSSDAQKDLIEIADYIERMSFSILISEKIVAEIIAKTVMLQMQPYMYPKIYKNYHSFSIKNRRIFYEINEYNKTVIIYHILGTYQQYEDYL